MTSYEPPAERGFGQPDLKCSIRKTRKEEGTMKRFKSIGVVLVLALALTMTIPVGYVAATENHHDYHFGHFIIDPIKTDAGYVAGTMFGDIGKEVRIYRGIPYAAPPVGNLRWKPPQPVVPWSGVRDCTQYSKTAAQKASPGTANFPLDED